jgi:hypothetical protein
MSKRELFGHIETALKALDVGNTDEAKEILRRLLSVIKRQEITPSRPE